jgi:hypothetical protein
MRTRRHLDEDKIEGGLEGAVGRQAETGKHGADSEGSGVAEILRLQRAAGNAAVRSLVDVQRTPAGPVIQRGPDDPISGPSYPSAGPGPIPGRGPMVSPEPLPDKFNPAQTPGGAAVDAAQVLIDGARKALDRVALDTERESALTALMAKEPSIYDTLHANPGKGLMVNINFKSTDPDTLPTNRPSDYKPALQVKFLGITVSDPFELPEPTAGPAATPAAAGAGDVGFGWKGHTLTASVRPVRPDPAKPKETLVIDTAEMLFAFMTLNGLPIPLVAGQLSRTRPSTVVNPLTRQAESVVEVNAFGSRLLVVEAVANAVADDLVRRGRKELDVGIARAARQVDDVQAELDTAAGEGATSRWWDNRLFRIDPHLLDSPRAHLAAARGYLESDDLGNAWQSLSACEDTIGLARNQLYAYQSNDFTDPFRQSPTSATSVV